MLIAFLGGRNAKTGKPMRIKSWTGPSNLHQFSLKFDPDKKYWALEPDQCRNIAGNWPMAFFYALNRGRPDPGGLR